jgi:hypothetical protein
VKSLIIITAIITAIIREFGRRGSEQCVLARNNCLKTAGLNHLKRWPTARNERLDQE